MGRFTERVDTEIQDAIYNKIINSSAFTDEEVLAKNEMIRSLNEFKLKHISRSKSVKPKTKELTYDMLSELLQIAKLSLKDMYLLVGVTVEWPDKNAKELCESCDRLPLQLLEKIKDTALGIAPDFWWNSLEIVNAQPTRRAMMILERKYYRSSRRNMEDGKVTPQLMKVWEDQKFRTTLKTVDFPEIAKNFEVPLQWLLRLDANTRVLAKKTVTETIMSAYLFMSPSNRKIIEQAVAMH